MRLIMSIFVEAIEETMSKLHDFVRNLSGDLKDNRVASIAMCSVSAAWTCMGLAMAFYHWSSYCCVGWHRGRK